jgi:AraC-like DNA-binding protein
MQHLLKAVRSTSLSRVLTPISERHRLLMLNSGSGRLRAQHTYDLGPGSLALLPAGQSVSVSERQNGDVRVLSFCGNCLGLKQGHGLIAPFRLARFSEHKVVPCDPDRQAWLNQLFDQIEAQQDDHFSTQYEVLKSLLLLVLHEVCLLYPIDKARPRSQNVESALLFIELNYPQPISLDDVAEQVHWSTPYLANKMKSETGRSVGEWLQTFRMADAASRLIHSHEGIAEIAQSVGYQDVTHFIRHFKRYHGNTPAAWRKAHQREAGVTFEYSLGNKLPKAT